MNIPTGEKIYWNSSESDMTGLANLSDDYSKIQAPERKEGNIINKA